MSSLQNVAQAGLSLGYLRVCSCCQLPFAFCFFKKSSKMSMFGDLLSLQFFFFHVFYVFYFLTFRSFVLTKLFLFNYNLNLGSVRRKILFPNDSASVWGEHKIFSYGFQKEETALG